MNKSSSVGSLSETQAAHQLNPHKLSLHEITLPQTDLRLPNISPKVSRARSYAQKAYPSLNLLSPSNHYSNQPTSPIKNRLREAFQRSPDESQNLVIINNRPKLLISQSLISPGKIKLIDQEEELQPAILQNSTTRRVGGALGVKASQSTRNTVWKFGYPVKIDRSDEQQNNALIQFNRELEELRQKVENLKNMNKKLLSEREMPDQFSRDDLHSMYQLLFLEDYKTEIRDLQEKISDLRINLSTKDKRIQALEKENQDLKTSLDLYRSLAVTRQLSDKTEKRGDQNAEAEDEIKLEDNIVEKLATLMRLLQSVKGVPNFIRKFMQDSTQIFECGYARIILVHQKLQLLCQEYFS